MRASALGENLDETRAASSFLDWKISAKMDPATGGRSWAAGALFPCGFFAEAAAAQTSRRFARLVPLRWTGKTGAEESLEA